MRSLKVLVADDDKEDRRFAKQYIEEYLQDRKTKKQEILEVEVKEAETPEQANQVITTFDPDLIILDVVFGRNDTNTSWIEEVLKPYRKVGGKAKIICWSRDPDYEWTVKIAGANKFLNKKVYYPLKDALIVQLETFGITLHDKVFYPLMYN